MNPRALGIALGLLLGCVTPCGAGALGDLPDPPVNDRTTLTVFVCPHAPPGPPQCRQWAMRVGGMWQDT